LPPKTYFTPPPTLKPGYGAAFHTPVVFVAASRPTDALVARRKALLSSSEKAFEIHGVCGANYSNADKYRSSNNNKHRYMSQGSKFL